GECDRAAPGRLCRRAEAPRRRSRRGGDRPDAVIVDRRRAAPPRDRRREAGGAARSERRRAMRPRVAVLGASLALLVVAVPSPAATLVAPVITGFSPAAGPVG